MINFDDYELSSESDNLNDSLDHKDFEIDRLGRIAEELEISDLREGP
jgi:hypothetical protein